jgi:hypothetical protein
MVGRRRLFAAEGSFDREEYYNLVRCEQGVGKEWKAVGGCGGCGGCRTGDPDVDARIEVLLERGREIALTSVIIGRDRLQ